MCAILKDKENNFILHYQRTYVHAYEWNSTGKNGIEAEKPYDTLIESYVIDDSMKIYIDTIDFDIHSNTEQMILITQSYT